MEGEEREERDGRDGRDGRDERDERDGRDGRRGRRVVGFILFKKSLVLIPVTIITLIIAMKILMNGS